MPKHIGKRENVKKLLHANYAKVVKHLKSSNKLRKCKLIQKDRSFYLSFINICFQYQNSLAFCH